MVMKTKELLLIFGIAISLIGNFFVYGESSTGFETGKIIDKVVCRANPGQSYALYLPSAYSTDKKWPIIYAFDPGARGRVPIDCFKAAAEKYGYIIVSSNNARNGPWEPIYQAGRAMWQDSRERLAINPRRIYATGFSGGARVASAFSYIAKQTVTGIIGCGAGLNINLKPENIKHSLYFGIVGLGDFNYSEMKKLDNDFDSVGITHRILVIDLGHQWPPQEYCTQAVEWMEINAIKQGLKENNEQLVTELYQKALNRAQQLEDSKNIFFKVSAYEAAQQLFSGIVEVSELKNKSRQLKESQEFKEFLKEEKKRDKKEADFIDLFNRVTTMVKRVTSADLPRPEAVTRSLKINYLQKEAEKSGSQCDRGLAQRLLLALGTKAYEFGSECFQKGDNPRTGIFFEIVGRVGTEYPGIIYNLACFYSKTKNKKKALHFFKQSLEKGFNNLEHIKKDTDLDFIRNETEFQEAIQQLEKNSQ